jgi:hypothetical protein
VETRRFPQNDTCHFHVFEALCGTNCVDIEYFMSQTAGTVVQDKKANEKSDIKQDKQQTIFNICSEILFCLFILVFEIPGLLQIIYLSLLCISKPFSYRHSILAWSVIYSIDL